MDTPFKLILMMAFVIIGFATFSFMFNSQNNIDEDGYVLPENESYDSLGVMTDLSIFDYIKSILDIKTGLPIIDNAFKALFTVLIAILIAWYLRAAS